METKHVMLGETIKEIEGEQDTTTIKLIKTTFRDKAMYTVEIKQGKEIAEFQFRKDDLFKANKCFNSICEADIVLDRYSGQGDNDSDKKLGETLEKNTPIYKFCGECGLGEKLFKVDDGRELCLDCIDDLGMIERGS